MIGAIAGDIIGSVFEHAAIKSADFQLFEWYSTFTDDTVLTIAVADAILNNKVYVSTLKEYGQRYPHAGYGGMFVEWLKSNTFVPYNSYGNGSAMRVSPVGFAFNALDEVLKEAEKSAVVTHNHPEGIKGAQAVASAIYLARNGKNKDEIKDFIESTFNYDLNQKLDDIRPGYRFDVTCQGSVPQSIMAFLESADYEDAVRLSISLGGDADTMACITGGIAEAYYKVVPENIIEKVREILDNELLGIIDTFYERFISNDG
ncbi:MAG: ADP-ribosylglycohydrolase family protein [Dehalococcoidales bacterium]|nr:MAG: ADP-ribosylglycohydrolase family protein [Dehalococcoidales bacterium]